MRAFSEPGMLPGFAWKARNLSDQSADRGTTGTFRCVTSDIYASRAVRIGNAPGNANGLVKASFGTGSLGYDIFEILQVVKFGFGPFHSGSPPYCSSVKADVPIQLTETLTLENPIRVFCKS
jgi:hypothetical protein